MSLSWLVFGALTLGAIRTSADPDTVGPEKGIAFVEFFGIPVTGIHFGANPSQIRNHPTVYFRYEQDSSSEVIEEIASKLTPSTPGTPYPPEGESYDADPDDGILAVADFHYANGNIHSIYVSLYYVYDDQLRMRYRNTCDFQEWYMRLSSFGILTEFDRKLIDACNIIRRRAGDEEQ